MVRILHYRQGRKYVNRLLGFAIALRLGSDEVFEGIVAPQTDTTAGAKLSNLKRHECLFPHRSGNLQVLLIFLLSDSRKIRH